MTTENEIIKRFEEQLVLFSLQVGGNKELVEAFREGLYEGLEKWLIENGHEQQGEEKTV